SSAPRQTPFSALPPNRVSPNVRQPAGNSTSGRSACLRRSQNQEKIRGGMMRTLWIDGGWKDSQGGRARRIENPATLELVDEVVDATAADVRRACAAAAVAQRLWKRVPAI